MKIAVTGATGLVGSRIVELLQDKFEFENSDVDITDQDKISKRIKNTNAQIVLHLAAKTDVDSCEKDMALGEKGDAWLVNVEGTKNIAEACENYSKKIIYVSTDFVFDGENPPVGGYAEKDSQNPINWYGRTKFEGEKIIQSLKSPWVLMRLAYPYRVSFTRPDFVRTILDRLKKQEEVKGVVDHIFTPTFIDDVAAAISTLLEKNATGIYHVAGSQSLSPYDAARLICQKFGFDKSLVSSITRAEYFRDRAPRPQEISLRNDKIQAMGVKMKSFEEGLDEFL